MPYVPLGARPVTAAADTTGMNAGNYTAMFDHNVISANVPYFEMYHIYLTSPSLVGSSTIATVLLNTYFWDVTLIGQANSWDPSQPMLMTPGDILYVFFNVPVSNPVKPVVTAWFRYQTTG